MTTYSLFIEDATKQELIDLLEVFLKASRTEGKTDKKIIPENYRSPRLEAKRAFCTQADQDSWGDNISCAICGKDLDGRQKWMDHGIAFCGELCAYEYRASECPVSNDLSGKENIPQPSQSSSQIDQAKLRAIITGYLDLRFSPEKILWYLKESHAIILSPAELAGYLGEMTE